MIYVQFLFVSGKEYSFWSHFLLDYSWQKYRSNFKWNIYSRMNTTLHQTFQKLLGSYHQWYSKLQNNKIIRKTTMNIPSMFHIYALYDSNENVPICEQCPLFVSKYPPHVPQLCTLWFTWNVPIRKQRISFVPNNFPDVTHLCTLWTQSYDMSLYVNKDPFLY